MYANSEFDHLTEDQNRLLEAVLPHVAFDGWSDQTLRQAIAETGITPDAARLAFPRGGIDMALAFHYRADRQLARELASPEGQAELAALKIREKITHAVRRRIEIVADDREAVRRGATLLALPLYTAEGAKALWNTADTIWTACGDASDDFNWYSKRAILSSVYSATLLFWMGDHSSGFQETWSFLDRRIANVMQFEKTKAKVQKNPVLKAMMWGPGQVLSRIKPPARYRTT